MNKNYEFYDRVVAETIKTIMRTAPENKIKIYRFDPENKTHLFYFHCAKILSTFGDFKIEINMPFKKWLFNKNYRKYRYIWTPYYHTNIVWNLDLVVREMNINPNIFEDIYDEYYAPQENK